jgi:hypothetical protein
MRDAKAKRAAEIQDSIRQVLYREWDPIGVAGWGPEDEYDDYIGPVYQILATNRSEEQLIALLVATQSGVIGVSCESPEHLRPVARSLLSIDVSL